MNCSQIKKISNNVFCSGLRKPIWLPSKEEQFKLSTFDQHQLEDRVKMSDLGGTGCSVCPLPSSDGRHDVSSLAAEAVSPEQSCPQLTRKPRSNWQTGGKWANSHHLLIHYRHKWRVLFHRLCCFECQKDTALLRDEAECLSRNSVKMRELLFFLIKLVLRQTLLEISPLWCHRGRFVKEGETSQLDSKTIPFWCLSFEDHLLLIEWVTASVVAKISGPLSYLIKSVWGGVWLTPSIVIIGSAPP